MFSLFDDYKFDMIWGLMMVTEKLQAFPQHDLLPVPKVMNHDFRRRFMAHLTVRAGPTPEYA